MRGRSTVVPPNTEEDEDINYPWTDCVVNEESVIPPAGTADPFGRGDGFDLDLAKVMLDVSVIPSMISPLEESEVPRPSRAA